MNTKDANAPVRGITKARLFARVPLRAPPTPGDAALEWEDTVSECDAFPDRDLEGEESDLLSAPQDLGDAWYDAR